MKIQSWSLVVQELIVDQNLHIVYLELELATELWEYMRTLCSRIISVLMKRYTGGMYLKFYCCLNRFTLLEILEAASGNSRVIVQ